MAVRNLNVAPQTARFDRQFAVSVTQERASRLAALFEVIARTGPEDDALRRTLCALGSDLGQQWADATEFEQ